MYNGSIVYWLTHVIPSIWMIILGIIKIETYMNHMSFYKCKNSILLGYYISGHGFLIYCWRYFKEPYNIYGHANPKWVYFVGGVFPAIISIILLSILEIYSIYYSRTKNKK